MRYDYSRRTQGAGRVECSECKRPKLGIGEDDPRRWVTIPPSAFDIPFCDCPDRSDLQCRNGHVFIQGHCAGCGASPP